MNNMFFKCISQWHGKNILHGHKKSKVFSWQSQHLVTVQWMCKLDVIREEMCKKSGVSVTEELIGQE